MIAGIVCFYGLCILSPIYFSPSIASACLQVFCWACFTIGGAVCFKLMTVALACFFMPSACGFEGATLWASVGIFGCVVDKFGDYIIGRGADVYKRQPM